jgi:hypothetical protein
VSQRPRPNTQSSRKPSSPTDSDNSSSNREPPGQGVAVSTLKVVGEAEADSAEREGEQREPRTARFLDGRLNTLPPPTVSPPTEAAAERAGSAPTVAAQPSNDAHPTGRAKSTPSTPAAGAESSAVRSRGIASGRAMSGEAGASSSAPDHASYEVSGRASLSSGGPKKNAPPVLASQSLLDDIAPVEPGRQTMRLFAVCLGGLCAILLPALAGHERANLLSAAGFAAMAVLGAVPVRYGVRAWGVALCAFATLLYTLFIRARHFDAPKHDPVLALAVMLLAAALLYRSSYRASRLGRFLVGVGLALGWTWLAISGGIFISVLDVTWQSWLPAALRGAFIILLLFSLLAFMSSATTGGCRVWAGALLVWYPVHLAVDVAARHLEPAAWRLGEVNVVAYISLTGAVAAATVLGALALWHLLSYAAIYRRQRWTMPHIR